MELFQKAFLASWRTRLGRQFQKAFLMKRTQQALLANR
jgi:hypothetical protein